MDLTNEKVLVIGLDGAEPSLVWKWIEEEKLPNLARISRGGTYGILKSTIPINSASAWTTFATGKNPGKHGIFSFCTRNANNYESHPINATYRHSKTMWNILDENNRKAVVINMPMSFPPEEINGVMISGFPTPLKNDGFTYPFFLGKDLEENGYRIDANLDYYQIYDADEFIKDSLEVAEKRTKITLDLMKKYEWNLLITVFTCLDRIQHFFWTLFDAEHPLHDFNEAERHNIIFHFYQKLDFLVGTILDNLTEKGTVIIMSDHGFGPIHRNFHVNTWLKQLNVLSLKKGAEVFTFVSELLHRIGVSSVVSVLSRLRLNNIVKKMEENIVKFNFSEIDWSKTRAYFAHHELYGISINLRGREPAGIVDPGKEYEEIRHFIIDEMKKLRDPETHELMVKKVFKREHLFSGPYTVKAPDILFTLEKDFASVFITKNSITTPIDEKLSGDHKLYGILLMRGANINRNFKIDSAEIADLLPTILYLIGVPVPSDIDGKVLIDAIDSSFLRRNPIKYRKVTENIEPPMFEFSKRGEEHIRKRLKGLGYIE